jgi:hypothetical protein
MKGMPARTSARTAARTAAHPPHVFGYGSLVNRATHAMTPAYPARLTGWRRVWVHTPVRPVAFLSVERAAGVTIEGLVAAVEGADWTALDAREQAYQRLPLEPATVEHAGPAGVVPEVYAVPRARAAAPNRLHPVLLSYLDTVVQGFIREFGPAGAARFFDTTAGWEAPILDDRAAPRYPRAQALSRAERAAVDDGLARLGRRPERAG